MVYNRAKTLMLHPLAQSMFMAIQKGNTRRVAELLDAGFPLEGVVHEGAQDTPLTRASHYPYPKTVELLIKRGAKVNPENKDVSPLFNAVSAAHVTTPKKIAIAKMLLEKGADIEWHRKKSYHSTPLIEAVKQEDLAMAEFLLSKGANVNKVSNENETALITLCSNENNSPNTLKIWQALVRYHVDVHALNDKALRQAAIHKKADLVEELLEHNPNAENVKKALSAAVIGAAGTAPTYQTNATMKFLAERVRDDLVETSQDEVHFPKGAHPLDKHPQLVQHLTKAIGTRDYAAIAELIQDAFILMEILHIPPESDFFYDLITPPKGQTFTDMANRIRVYAADNFTSYEETTQMMDEIYSSLILPLAWLQHKSSKEDFYVKAHGLPYGSAEKIVNQIQKIGCSMLLSGKNLEDILGLSEAWHSPRYAMPAELRPLASKGEWYPLVQPSSYEGGYKIVARVSAKELEDESRILKHCVGTSSSYSKACLNGETHILSITDNADRPLMTVEVKLHVGKAKEKEDVPLPDGAHHLHIVQMQGERRKPIPEAAKHVFNQWKTRVASGEVAISFAPLGETKVSKLQREGAYNILDKSAGYEITPENVERVFQHFRGTSERVEDAARLAPKKGLRSVTYNPQTDTFEENRTHLISGLYHETDEAGRKTGKSVKREDLTLAQWCEATGGKQRLAQFFTERKTLWDTPVRYSGHGRG